jgi:TPR repeat protein
LFKTRYLQFNGGKIWDDTPACGSSYFKNVISKNKKIKPTALQKVSISNGNSEEWDLTTLAIILINQDRPGTLNTTQIQQLDREDKLVKQLTDIRNNLVHHVSKSIADVEFNQLWTDIATIIVAFGDDDRELDTLKDDKIFEPRTQSVNEENVKEASRLNSLATQAHKDGRFSDAISLFIKATVLPGVLDRDRAIFFSNMSSTRLALYEQGSNPSNIFEIDDLLDQRYRALQDAKQARNLWLTWWKAHLRVGKVYATLNEHEKAINSFEQAFALAPTNHEIQKALDESRVIHCRQSGHEHLDPRSRPGTVPEQLNELQQKFGIDPQKIRMGRDLIGMIDPSAADAVKGQKYLHGDIDVKQDYEQAAKYFAKAASQGNAEGMYQLAWLTDCGLGVKKDHDTALKLLEQAAAQPPQYPKLENVPNPGVAEAEHSLGFRYANGVSVHKSLPTAAYWYQRATNHGNAESANSLAFMYRDGTGVDRNVEKAEQLLKLSARRRDPNAMLNLAEFLRDKNDLQMAKIWYDRACESGNIVAQMNRDAFAKTLEEKQQFLDHCPTNVLRILNAAKNMLDSLETGETTSVVSNHRYIDDYDMLNEYANRGSTTAKRLCDALENFVEALSIVMQFETLTEEQEDMFVHELSQCFRIEHIVAQIPGIEMHNKIKEVIDRVLHRCSAESNLATSQLDEDARICYATLRMDSHELIAQFLGPCKQKYPKSTYFFQLSAAMNGFLKRFEATLYDANTGLQIDPYNCELLYDKAGALRLIGNDMNEAIEAYRTFLSVAPKDHRKVPDAYYAMAGCYLVRDGPHDSIDFVEKTYKQGEEAEKVQLPCFSPYDSNGKRLLKALVYPESVLNTGSTPTINRKSHLTDPHRIELITQHRDWQSRTSQDKNNPNRIIRPYTLEPRVKQQTAKSLVELKPITLREMNPTKDYVYDGCVLSVTIIEEVYSWVPSIHLVVEDEHLDCERMCIYNFPEGQGEYFTRKVFTIGSKMHIINPYLRIGTKDMKSTIRIDDFSSIMMQSESERVINMCRCCGKANAPHVCSKCKQARYCTKECQTMDWQTYKHKLICKH